MTAKEKIEETEHNLRGLKRAVKLKTFWFELSNFLASASSILDHLLEEYNHRYQLGIKRVDIQNFKRRAEKESNQAVVVFVHNWRVI